MSVIIAGPSHKNRRLTPRRSFWFALLATLVLMPGCQTVDPNSPEGLAALKGFKPQDTDKLFVVDCLLPGQVRKLGTQLTYLTARRAIKTTAGECEIRGGEYVAYDRANLASALKIWLPLAQQGDPEAQINVGEIYEKGLGAQADPKLAAEWYRKAAEAGHSRAQINLGYLYEKGLGVEKDLTTALNWYRKASGLENTDLQFASVVEAQFASAHEQELEALRQDAARRKFEAEQLRRQLSDTQHQLKQQQDTLRSIQNNLEQKKQQLEQEKNKSTRNESLLRTLERELKAGQSEFDDQKTKISNLERSLEAKQKTIDHSTQAALSQEQQLIAKAPQRPSSDTQAVIELSNARIDLQKNETLLQEKESGYLKIANEIKRSLEATGLSADQGTGSSHDQLRAQEIRGNLERQKQSLQTSAQEINALKNKIEQQRQSIAKLEKSQLTQLASVAPTIEIIDPPMVLTRGVPSLLLRSISPSKTITGKVDAPAGLKSLLVNDKPESIDTLGFFKINVAIKESTTPVNIVAIDNKEKRTSLNFNILTQTETPAEIIDSSAPTLSEPSRFYDIDFGRYHALIIGNNDYSQLPTLKTAINDAKAVESILRQRYGFKTTLLQNANRHQIMTALNNIRNTLKEKDNLLIYYAGHGERDKTSLAAYWLPTDAEIDNTANWISSDDITRYLNIIAARHILVVADSCYSGAMTGTSVARLPDGMPEDKREKWLKFMTTRKARTVLTSGGVAPVLDEGDDQHSIFARAFIDALQNNRALIEDYDIFRSVSKQVRVSASRVGFAQSPQYAPLQHAGHEGSPFFFVPGV